MAKHGATQEAKSGTGTGTVTVLGSTVRLGASAARKPRAVSLSLDTLRGTGFARDDNGGSTSLGMTMGRHRRRVFSYLAMCDKST
jgi:hypothetical protein